MCSSFQSIPQAKTHLCLRTSTPTISKSTTVGSNLAILARNLSQDLYLDLDLLVKSFMVSRRMLEHEPFRSAIVREVLPGPEADTEDKIRGKYLLNFFSLLNLTHEQITSRAQ